MRFETDVKEFCSALAHCAKTTANRKKFTASAVCDYVKIRCCRDFVYLTALDGVHLVEKAVAVQNATAGGGVYSPKAILSALRGFSGTLLVAESENGDGKLHLFCAGLQIMEPRFYPIEDYMNTDRLLEDDIKIPFEVGFNAKLLAETVLAVAGSDGVVRLRMENDGTGPMLISNRTSADRGLVLPYRLT